MLILVPTTTTPVLKRSTVAKMFHRMVQSMGFSKKVAITLTLVIARKYPVKNPIIVAETILEEASSKVNLSISFLVMPMDRRIPIYCWVSFRFASMLRISLKMAKIESIKIILVKKISKPKKV